jgi:hypothetical protein
VGVILEVLRPVVTEPARTDGRGHWPAGKRRNSASGRVEALPFPFLSRTTLPPAGPSDATVPVAKIH